MDIVLEVTDTFLFDYAYAFFHPAKNALFNFDNTTTAKALSTWQYKPATVYLNLEPSQAAYQSAWARDNIYRQSLSFFLILWLFGLVVYYIFAAMSYAFVFDKKQMQHPKFLKNQVWLEMKQANQAFPFMSICTVPFLIAEVRGYSKLYDTPAEAPASWYNWVQFPLFLIFTDCFIYLIHRGLHHPLVYKRLHKPHHKWIIPTPFASHAFHPLDGFAQSVPYHVFPFIFPLQKLAYVAMFVIINFWTIMIHDGEFYANNPVINGAACHSVHHYAFNYNYGQYTTLWDRLGGSYRQPDADLFQKEATKKMWEKQTKEMEDILKDVEGEDDREYVPATKKSQ